VKNEACQSNNENKAPRHFEAGNKYRKMEVELALLGSGNLDTNGYHACRSHHIKVETANPGCPTTTCKGDMPVVPARA
jgi:hypothetical protein